MKKRPLILFLVMFLLMTTSAQSETNMEQSYTIINKISDEALQMVQVGRYDDAVRLLTYFSHHMLSFTAEDQLLSMDDARIITVSHQEALDAVLNNEISAEQRINKVTKLRLLVDTITSSYEPLWVGMEEPMLTVLYDIKESLLDGERDAFHAQLNTFLSLYEVVYPSLKIDVPTEAMQQLEMRILYIDQYRPHVLTASSGQQELEILEDHLKQIFSRVAEDDADPSLWWVILSTGSIIIVTLSYVGWRKYLGDKRKKRVRSNRHNN